MTNEAQIWNFLIAPDKIGNPYGVAGLMGNLQAESGLNPVNLQNSGNKDLKLSDEEYTNAVDNGSYSKTKFINDKYGYGIAQWTNKSRKERLYSLAKSWSTSIGNLVVQLEFLWNELQTYSAVLKVLKAAKTVREASDIVITKYEKPANQSESVKKKREKLGSDIFTRMREKKRYVVIRTASVNVRIGPNKNHKTVGYAYRKERFPLIETDPNTGWHRIEWHDYFGDCIRDDVWVTGKHTAIEEGGDDI